MILQLLQTGNTIDGVSIGGMLNPQDFSTSFQTWSSRRCHGCLEYILDTERALTCFNLSNSSKPCKNIYCYRCVTFKKKIVENSSEEAKAELKHWRQQKWASSYQNILYQCPCCQD